MNENTMDAINFLRGLLSRIEIRGIEQGSLEITGFAGTFQTFAPDTKCKTCQPTGENTILIHFRYEGDASD